MSRERFEPMYAGQPPWDIPGPQPAFVELEESGAIAGSVLDVGCGTGENALYLASRGHETWGSTWCRWPSSGRGPRPGSGA